MTINIYCDESCHLEAGQSCAMAWGAIACDAAHVQDVSTRIRAIKQSHGLASTFEIKWTKVSPAQEALYMDLLDEFFRDHRLRFRGLVVPDKDCLDHERFGQTHDDWYYKMYFTMLQWMIQPGNQYRIYLDIKDTRGGARTRKLHEVLANKFHDFQHESIERVQQIRSHESELMQLADLMLGALTYEHRGLSTSTAKLAMIARLKARLGTVALSRTSPFGSTKFNLLVWNPREETL